MTEPKSYPAGKAHYRGDRTSAVGDVLGPTTFGMYVRAESADYDAESDVTTIHFATLPVDGDEQ